MKITMVKKILKDGSPCRKCGDVLARLEKENWMGKIDEVLVADERDEQSEGMKLAKKLNVELAPFFVVSDGDEEKVYTSYFKFVKEVLSGNTSASEETKEILEQNPDLDFI